MRQILLSLVMLLGFSGFATAASLPVEFTGTTENAIIDGVPESFDIKNFHNRVMMETNSRLAAKGVKLLPTPNDEKEKITAKYKVDYVGHKFRVFMVSPGYKIKYNITVTSATGAVLCSKNNNMGDSNLLDLANEIAEYLTKNITTPCADD